MLCTYFPLFKDKEDQLCLLDPGAPRGIKNMV